MVNLNLQQVRVRPLFPRFEQGHCDYLQVQKEHCHHDHFKDSNPNIEWKATLEQGEKIGLGTREYELKKI